MSLPLDEFLFGNIQVVSDTNLNLISIFKIKLVT